MLSTLYPIYVYIFIEIIPIASIYHISFQYYVHSQLTIIITTNSININTANLLDIDPEKLTKSENFFVVYTGITRMNIDIFMNFMEDIVKSKLPNNQMGDFFVTVDNRSVFPMINYHHPVIKNTRAPSTVKWSKLFNFACLIQEIINTVICSINIVK